MKKFTVAVAAIFGLTQAADNANLGDLKGIYDKYGKDIKHGGKYKGDYSKYLGGGKKHGGVSSSGPFKPHGINYDYTCTA